MTVKVTEITQEDRATLGMRLREARDAKRLSRPQLHELTGIPARSIEKFELGIMSPSTDRLQKLSDVLDISIDYLISGQDKQPENIEPNLDAGVVTEPDVDPHSDAVFILEEIAEKRETGFQNYWRSAPSLFEKLNTTIQGMEFDTLLDVAEDAGIMAIPTEVIRGYPKMSSAEQGEVFDALAERIYDAAYFGIDLFKLDTARLENLAEKLELQPDIEGFFSDDWSSDHALINALRPIIRPQALRGIAPKFTKETDFPLREVA